jgi:YesN/AraC family two-component response regulator
MTISSSPTGELSALRAVIDYCTRHFTNEISLSSLEEELHLSKYYISHLFNNRIHVHFNHYVNSLRIYEAKRLLRHSDKSITAIGEEAGFGTLRTFNRAFHKQMGCTPGEYRRKESKQ